MSTATPSTFSLPDARCSVSSIQHPASSNQPPATSIAIMLVVTSVIVGSAGNIGALAADKPSDDDPPVIYRRILVPAEAPAAWPTATDKYLPIESQEFDAWIAAANRPHASTARIAVAEYSARLEGDRLALATASWTIELDGDGPAFLPMANISLVVHWAEWRDQPGKPALLGLWPRRAGQPSTYGLVVPRSGVLDVRWHTLGATGSASAGRNLALAKPVAPRALAKSVAPGGRALEIPLRFPVAAMTRLTLDLPDPMIPTLDGSVVLESSPLESSEIAGARNGNANEPKGTVPVEWRRWVLAVGDSLGATGSASAGRKLALAKPVAPGESTTGRQTVIPPTVSFRDEMRYQITERGLDVEDVLRFDPSGSPLGEVNVDVPAGLKLVDATANGRVVRWRTEIDSTTQIARAVIEIPEPASDGETTLVLKAWGTLVTDQAWALPKLQVEDAMWTAGSLEIAVDELLELQELNPIDCRQIDVHLEENSAGRFETSTFQSFSPAAGVAVIVGQRRPSGHVRSNTTVQVDHPDVRGRHVAQINVGHGSLQALSAKLQPDWLIDAVETIPADVLGEWYVQSRLGGTGSASAGRNLALAKPVAPGALAKPVAPGTLGKPVAPGVRTLELQLNRAATPARSVTIIVTGRLQRFGTSDRLGLENLAMIHWPGFEVERNLLQLQAADPYELAPLGDLPLVAASDLSDSDKRLVEARIWEDEAPAEPNLEPASGSAGASPSQFPDGEWIDLVAAASDAAVRLVATRGNYDAEIQLDAVIAGPLLKSTYHVVCRPLGSGVDEILMYFSEPLQAKPQWTNADTRERLDGEPVPASDPRLAGVPAGGELWLLPLRRTYLRPISLSATMTSPLSTSQAIPLLSLPAASLQRGRIAVRSDEIAMPSIAVQGPTPVPLPNVSQRGEETAADSRAYLPRARSPARAAYQYQPIQFYDVGSSPRIWLGPPAVMNRENALLATRVVVKSFYAASGRGVHRATYHLENRGASSVRLAFDAGTELVSASFDGQSLAPSTGEKLAGTVSLALPRLRTTGLLTLDFETQAAPLAGGCHLPSPLPESEITILFGDWTVWLPEEFGVTGDTSSDGEKFSWRKRIFGPFARPVQLAEHTTANDRPTSSLGSGGVPLAVSADGSVNPIGWRPFRVGFVDRGPQPIAIVHAPASAAWSLSIFLALFFVLPRCQLRATHMVILTASAAVLSVLLPAAYAPLATGAFFGLLLAPLRRWIIQTRSVDAEPGGGSRIAGQTLSAVLLAAICTITLFCGGSQAQTTTTGGTPTSEAGRETDDANPRAGTTIHRVLVPVDDEGKQVGSKVFVSDRFARRLLRMSQAHRLVGGSWLLTGMHCEGNLSHRGAPSVATPGSWTLTLEIEVLTRDVVVELPLVEEQAEWPRAASVDGIPTPIVWNPNGIGCQILVREPGRYGLLLRFEPRTRRVADRQQVDLSLPPFAGATVQLTSSDPVADPSVGGCRLEPRQDDAGALWIGELDRSGRLVIDWTDRSATSGLVATPRLDELCWLRVEPHHTYLDVKYISRHTGPWPDEMTIRVASQCELLPDVGDGRDTVVERLPDGRQSITAVTTSEANDARREMHLRFRISSAAPLGRLRIPTVELVSMPVDHRWLAVSADPSLECVPIGDVAVAADTVADFAAAWGVTDDDAAPSFVLAADGLAQASSLDVRPRNVPSETAERLYVAVGKKQFSVAYQADVAPRGDHRFRRTLSVPAELSVESVAAEQNGSTVPLRWVRRSPDRVHVFFASKTSESYRLELTGRVSVAGYGEHALPRISADGTPRANQTLLLYREENIAATLHPRMPDTLSATMPTEPLPAGWDFRFVGTRRIDPMSDETQKVVTEPNRVVLAGRSRTTLFGDGGLWFATFACHVRVEQGELDALQFRLPTNWAGPFEVQAAAGDTTVTSTDEQGMLTVRFGNSIQAGDGVAFEIRSPLTVVTGQPVSVPLIAPLIAQSSAGRWEQFVSIPTPSDATQAEWTRAGVELAELPADLPANLTPPSDAETYRVVSDTFRVALHSRPSDQARSVIRLAEMTAVEGPNGGQFMVTRFLISPQGVSECELEVPRAQRLVRATLDQHPAIIRSLESHRWSLQLGPPNLPQILEIVTRESNPIDTSDRRKTFRRPTLLQRDQPVPVELSLWSLCRPANSASLRVSGAAPATAGDQAVLRLDRLVSISASATRSAIESPAVDGYRWFANWSERLLTAERAARALDGESARLGRLSAEIASRPGTRGISSVPGARDSIAAAIARSEAWRRQAAELLAISETIIAPEDGPGSDQIGWQDVATPPGCVWHYFVSDGGQERLSVESAARELTPVETRVVVVFCVVLLATTLGWFVGQPAAREAFVRWQYGAAALFGLAAWAWLRPSWLGLLIFLVSLMLWLHERLTRQTDGLPGSSASTVASDR